MKGLVHSLGNVQRVLGRPSQQCLKDSEDPRGKNWPNNILDQQGAFPASSPDVFIGCRMMKNQGEKEASNRK
jgi:hypothetical protein